MLATLGLAGAATAAIRTAAPAGPRVLFADEFDGDALDRGDWRTCHWWSDGGCTIASNDEREWYRRGQVSVAGGAAHLTAARRTTTGADGRRYPFRSGMISTGPGPERKPRFAFTYGRATARMRVPAGDGMWPAFWLLPADRNSKPEIDVVEVNSDLPDTVKMHIHGADSDEGHRWKGLTPGWHTFAVDWRRGRLTWYVDGVRRWRVTGDLVPHEPMYLIANLAVSSDPPPTDDTPDEASLDIDWIRVKR